MAKINLDTEVRFKGLLKELGFKKKKIWFVRPYKDATQELGFGHSTNNERHVRYYDCMCGLNYPRINEIAEKLGVFAYGPACQLGDLMPQRELKEWRLSEDDSDEYYIDMIHDIVSSVKDYALPHLEKYSTLEEYVKGAEYNVFPSAFKYKSVPIAYYLLGDRDNAMKFLNRTLERLARRNDSTRNWEVIETGDYEKLVIHSKPDRDYVDYKAFAEKFKLLWE